MNWDWSTHLKYVKYTYIITRFIQIIFQLSFLFYLLGNPEKYEISIILACGITVIGAVMSAFVLLTVYEKLFREDANYCDYIHLIGVELTIFALALTTYPIAMKNIEIKYKNNKEKLYNVHHGNSPSGLKVSEISRNLRYLDEETINEPIETTTKHLIDKALNIREDFISFISTERSSDIAFPQNEKSLEFKTSSEDYYNNYVNLILALSIISIFLQLIIFCSLVFGEFVKYRIRKEASVQPAIEMVASGGAGGNNN